MIRLLVIAALVGAALAAPAAAHAMELVAAVNQDTSITLRDDQNRAVTRLQPGTYRITVHDRTEFHNFRLRGPGVDRATSVEGTGTVVWEVRLVEGVYRFVCDPHASSMRGAFTVGVPQSAPPPRRLVANVGPRSKITLTQNGRVVRSLAAGAYVITVRDRSRAHNFHLRGPGVNRKTSVRGLGTFTWRVTLRAGTYRFACDPHARRMRGSFTVRR